MRLLIFYERFLDYKLKNHKIEKHPLYFIMNSDDERLITHHTTRRLIKLKYRVFPHIAFLLDLFLYIAFTSLCTFYNLISNEKIFVSLAGASENNSTNAYAIKDVYKIRQLNLELDLSLVVFLNVCLVTIVAIHLSKEFFQMITYNLKNYFSSVDNWFQMSALVITIVSLIPLFPHQIQVASGSFSILFAWICMSLFFQDLELFSLGKYIVAFRKTIQNSFKFMPFFFMICIGFFFSQQVGDRMNLHPYNSNITW